MLCRFATVEATVREHHPHVDLDGTSRQLRAELAGLGIQVGKSSINDHRATPRQCACGPAKITKHAQKSVRILTIDIETAPNLAYVWGLWDQNIGLTQLQETSSIICFAAKWYDSDDIMFHSDHRDGHEAMVKRLYDLICEADLVVHYNGIAFDMKHIHREFLLAGFNPPKTYRNIDLMRTVKQKFKFVSNKLDHVAQQLGLGAKTNHTGFQLWLDCMAGDAEAWALMETYNLQDVALTERLYDRLRPWIPNHPHLGMWTGDDWSCPSCGHKDVSTGRDGESHTNVQRYREYECPSCGTRIRGNQKLLNATQTRQATSR